MSLQTLEVSIAGPVATVTLSRPNVHNALNETAISELADSFRMLGQRHDVRAIVLAAAGKSFCSGADLNWMKRMAGFSDEENRADALGFAAMLYKIYTCPKPVVARVQGDVVGGGVGLIAAVDIAIAA